MNYGVIQKWNLIFYIKQGNTSRVEGQGGGGVVWEYFKNETGSRIFDHETTKCKLQTVIYYGDFGVLQKSEFFGFILMKLEFWCTKSCIIFEFWFYIYETNQRFSASLHRNRLRCNNFEAVIFFHETFLQFHTVSFFSPVSLFLWNSFHTFCQFHKFFPLFFA